MKSKIFFNANVLLELLFLLSLFACQSAPKKAEVEEKIIIEEKDYKCNFVDYFPWRGDLTFAQEAVNEIDMAILAQLSYNNYGGIVSNNMSSPKKLKIVAKEFENSSDFETRKYNGPLINAETTTLLKLAGISNRFGNIDICNFVDEIDDKVGTKFSAYTAILDSKTAAVVYRGTYTEIVDWEEDFNMTFKFPVPAQTRAVEYLEKVAKEIPQNIVIVGHSKGGNLAMYAAAYCKNEIKNRIQLVCNLDGQGFPESAVKNENFKSINEKLITLLPQSSVIGMLFHRNGSTKIVQSNQTNLLFQHDMFSWQILGNKFLEVSERTEKSVQIETDLKALLESLDENELQDFVKGSFGIFKVANAKTLQEFQKNWFSKLPEILEYLGTLDKKTKKNLYKLIKIII